MGVRWRVRASAVCATALTGLLTSTGFASAAVPDSHTQIQQFENSLSRSSNPTTQLTLHDFKRASYATQVRFLQALSDPATFQADTTVKNFTRSVSSTRSTTNSTLYATYDVTATEKAGYQVFGVTVMQYTQQYKYQTGLNRVLDNHACNGWVSGFSGLNSYSYTSNMWISGGLGSCDVYNVVSLIYKGFGYQYTKEGYIQTSGSGVVQWWLKNVS